MLYDTLLLDIDGVLVDEDNNLNIKLCNLLQEIEKKISVHVVTARPMIFAKNIIESFSSKHCMHVFDNGAFVSDLMLKEILVDGTIKNDYLLTIIEMAEQSNKNLRWGGSSKNRLFTNEHYLDTNKHSKNEIISESELSNIPINSMWFYGLTIDEVTKISQILHEEIKLTHFIEKDQSHSIFMQPKKTSKESGFELIRKHYSISLNQTVYVADSSSDIELLKLVGFRACPQNSSENVMQICDFVAAEKYTQGTLEILEHLFPH